MRDPGEWKVGRRATFVGRGRAVDSLSQMVVPSSTSGCCGGVHPFPAGP